MGSKVQAVALEKIPNKVFIGRKRNGFLPVRCLWGILFAIVLIRFFRNKSDRKEQEYMDMKKIGAFIAACRKEKGYTQQQLAEKLGVTNKTVSRWETGGSLR